MGVEFNYDSPRSVKARIGRHLSGLNERLLVLLTVLLIIVGAGLVIFGAPIGWLLIGLSAWPAMLLRWYRGELKNIPPGHAPERIDDVLVSEVLAWLPKQPTAQDVAAAVSRTDGGLFYGARFGLTPNFLQHISSTEQSDVRSIWDDALAVMHDEDSPVLTAGMVVYALVKQVPDHDALLANNHLELRDIQQGIKWQLHLAELIRHHSARRRTGGIGRDWSFGYTPLLARFGQNISQQIASGGLLNVELESHGDAIDQLVDTFSHDGRQNAVLVGATGVGKTTIVTAFAERLLDASSNLPVNLKFRQVIMLDSASLLSAAPGRGQLEQLIMELFGEAYAAKNIILCLDDAQLFFEEGVGSVDLANVLLPIINAGRLRLILTMDEQRYLQIGQRNSALVNALNRVNIKPATKSETIKVMQDQLILTEFKRKVTYTYQALDEAYRLSERYVHDLAMPGRALKLLETAATYSQDGLVTMNSVQNAIEQTMDVKVSVASEGADREKLLHLEDSIHERMINQVRAVGVVSDALRRARD